MSYTIEQQNGNNIYVYEAISYWDKAKQQPRQKRNYLGKKDNTGKIEKVRGSFKPKSSKDWGNVYLLKDIASRIGVEEVLKTAYPDEWKHLLGLAIYEVCEGKPLYLFKLWQNRQIVM